MLTPVKKSRVSDEVMEQLTRMIVSGEFESGKRLPSERALTEMLEINRTSLREALRRMENMGLVSVRIGDGIYAEDYSLNPTLDFAKFALETGIGLDREVIISLCDMLRMFVVEVIRLAADRGDAESLDRMQEVLDSVKESRSKEVIQEDWVFQFVRELTLAARSRLFTYLLNDLKDVFGKLAQMNIAIDGSADPLHDALTIYQTILDLLREGHKDRLIEYISGRMKRYYELVPRFVEAGEPPG